MKKRYLCIGLCLVFVCAWLIFWVGVVRGVVNHSLQTTPTSENRAVNQDPPKPTATIERGRTLTVVPISTPIRGN